MVEEIVAFLASAVSRAATLSAYLFNQTGTWPLVFAAISVVLITRFLLGPILGVSVDFISAGISDKYKFTKKKSSSRSNKKSSSRSNSKSSSRPSGRTLRSGTNRG